ncbi:MAG TPA: hypothetical protein VFT41_11415 [Gemmatimonadaceae bacterium]|nr:hypothetical protein [Gemmatimonadaceae bacterium]
MKLLCFSRLALLAGALILGAATVARAQRGDNPHGPTVTACGLCHRPDAWTPVAISKDFHHAPGVFPLDGAHAKAPCTACHRSLDFSQASTACASCHTDVHQGEFGNQCARCHTTRSFIDPAAMRRMHDLTRFPLRGAHAIAACESCHQPTGPGQAQYANRPTTCFGCHMRDYQQAKNPDHVAGAYPQVCTECHSMVSWQGAAFDHSRTGFPLTGAHLAVACNACHGDGVYKGKSTACSSCHQADYDKTTDPPHAAAGFPTACETCHSTTNWTSATFNHNNTAFPLTGAHAGTACSACHGDGVYKGKSTACVSCHLADYNGTNNPAHAAAGFPQTCGQCHTTSTWAGATFNHDASFFPIYSGTHQGKWSQCSDCHTAPSNYAAFTCMSGGCHGQSTTDANHSGVSGYRYDATACYSCHPRGSGG